jgi:Tfp pilus assembly protein PilF
MPAAPHPLVLRARDALARGDLRAAEAAAEERLKTAGRDVNALEMRALIQQRRGQFGQAAKTLDTVIGIDRRADWAFNELIQLFMTHGRLGDAEKVARAALRANPENPQGNNLFGYILSEMNDLPSGEWHFRRALELAGPQAAFMMNLGLNLMKQGRTDEADGCFAKAHELDPRDLKTLAYWSTLHEGRGDLARAQELLARAVAVSSADQVSLLRANYLARTGRHQEAFAVFDTFTELSGAGYLERGRLNDRVGRYAEAWQDFVEGKRRLAAEGSGLKYKREVVETLFTRCGQFFTRENCNRLPKARRRPDMPQPIFIVGFPRSGTTLIEQILCSHSRVRAGGELTLLDELRKLSLDVLPDSEGYPENLAQSWTADRRFVASVFRDYYLARAEQYGLCGGDRAFFTDKMPFNEINLPLLKMVFPEAKIIHAVRHPLDVCVSMLSNNMTHGFACGYRIEDIVHHLTAVFTLTEHYRSTLEANEHILKYETLIADQEGQTRKLLEYLELPFEAACLRPHENPRYVPTLSYAQVTEPIHAGSVNRHGHYAQFLQPYVGRLRPILERYGYSHALEPAGDL